jgi:hypothetical protein
MPLGAVQVFADVNAHRLFRKVSASGSAALRRAGAKDNIYRPGFSGKLRTRLSFPRIN